MVNRMFNRTLVATTVAVVVSACAASGEFKELESGDWQIDCSGGYHNWSGCHTLAKRICGNGGFDIVSQITNEGGGNVGSKDWSATGSIVSRSMVVRCL